MGHYDYDDVHVNAVLVGKHLGAELLQELYENNIQAMIWEQKTVRSSGRGSLTPGSTRSGGSLKRVKSPATSTGKKSSVKRRKQDKKKKKKKMLINVDDATPSSHEYELKEDDDDDEDDDISDQAEEEEEEEEEEENLHEYLGELFDFQVLALNNTRLWVAWIRATDLKGSFYDDMECYKSRVKKCLSMAETEAKRGNNFIPVFLICRFPEPHLHVFNAFQMYALQEKIKAIPLSGKDRRSEIQSLCYALENLQRYNPIKLRTNQWDPDTLISLRQTTLNTIPNAGQVQLNAISNKSIRSLTKMIAENKPEHQSILKKIPAIAEFFNRPL